jgi:hypothetical protein
MGVELNLPRYMGSKVSLNQIGCWAIWQGENGLMKSLLHNWMKGKITVPKLDGLRNHSGKQMCKVIWFGRVLGKSYISSINQHVWNEKIYAITGHDGINFKLKSTIRLKNKIKCNLLAFSIFWNWGDPSLTLRTCMGFYSFWRWRTFLTNIGWTLVVGAW